ncbi:MAG: oligosaccharide flippase family protein [Elainellaceae cyanobacterium]
MVSLKKKAIHGAAWTFIGYGASQGLRFAGNIVLTRLLIPEYFGLMSLINTFVIGLVLFSDVGIGPSIIQNKRGNDTDFINTAWTIQVIRGFGLWICSLLIAWPVASFYEDNRLLWLIPVVSLTTIIQGFYSVSLHLMKKSLNLGKLTVFEFITQTISLSVMISWALISPNVWALVGGNIISTSIKMAWSHRLIPDLKHRFTWEPKAVQEIFSFGKWIFVSTAMTFLAAQSDRLILGKLFSFEMLGVYTVAFTLADLPSQVIKRLANQVIFPVVSQQAGRPRAELRENIAKKRFLLLLTMAFGVALLFNVGDFIILTLYDDNYRSAAWMLPLLAVGIWPMILFYLCNSILLSVGQSIYGAVGYNFKLVYMVVAVPLAYQAFGLLGAIATIALNDILPYFVAAYGLWREKLSFIRQDLLATLIMILSVAALALVRHILGFDVSIGELFV